VDGGFVELSAPFAEHLATVQGARTGDGTAVAVRLSLPDEVRGVLDGVATDPARDAAERFVLRHADVLLTPGGDVVAALERFYGEPLAPEVVSLGDLGAAAGDAELPWLDEHGTLRLVFVGDLAPRTGIRELLDAMALLGDADVTLTVRGAGPLASEVATAVARDRRVSHGGPATAEGASLAVRDAHAAVVCPRWDVLPGIAVRALALNRPVLATPVGGLVELIEPDRSGWLAAGTAAADLAAAIADIRADPDGYLRLGDGPRARHTALADRAAPALPVPAPRALPDLDLRAVVVHTGDRRALERTLDAVAASDHPVPQVTVVDDGHGGVADVERRQGVRLLAQTPSGVAAARNLGVAVAGGDLTLVLDGGDVPEPGFVGRALRAFARDPRLAYVTSWTDHERPLGTEDALIDAADVGGPPAALVRPEVFEHHPRLDGARARWFHQRLWRLGLRGAVIPELLLHTASRPGAGAPDDAALRAAHRARAVRWMAA
jgi:hypothetical protein